MNFLEAVKAMEKGKKVKLPGWMGYLYIDMGSEKISNRNGPVTLHYKLVTDEEWVAVEEKKTLSDKVILNGVDTFHKGDMYKGKDVNEAIKEIKKGITNIPRESELVRHTSLGIIDKIVGERLI